MMEKTFNPTLIEQRMRALWEDTGAFRAGRPERLRAKPYSIVIPPPNVTGSLHMGHALNNTLQDILARYHRMRGDDVLWQPGTDHAGIATQMVVERQLAERNEPSRRELGREKFLERVWSWKAESGGKIVEQLKRLGASCDWSRERFTLDDGLSRAVIKVFVQLYRDGLLYKDKRLVNWDPVLHTAISDLEVQQVEMKGHLWRFKYPIVDAAGQKTGAFITVATTRPETLLGDTAVAVHPEDARYHSFIGKNISLPLVGRHIPIIADSYSDPEKGTGAVKITPAHDFNDFEVGKRHGLRLINVLDAQGRLSLSANSDFHEGLTPSAELAETLATLDGLDRFAARQRIVTMMSERELLEGVDDHKHMVPHGDRSQAVLEPRLTDQWYVDAKTLACPALEAVRTGKTTFIPKNWEKTYFDWLENIQPWCVSRQLWWGHRIPAWYDQDGNVYVEETEEAAQIAARARTGESVALKRDDDVLDTWFSSALWPFSTLGWPEDSSEQERYYPTNVLVTGFDIIFFWVARMMMMGLHFKKEIPFKDVYIHALVRDEKGAKMSKSKGNVIDPLHLIDDYGADALRFTLAAMAAQGRDIKLSTQRVEGYRNFATKIWNASRFAEFNGCARVNDYDPSKNKIVLNRWIVGEAARTIDVLNAEIEAYRFNDAAASAYRFVWNIFCDWYLELAKPLLQGPDGAAKEETRATVAFVLDQIYALLHPFMPFLTEELWAIKGEQGPPRQSLLALANWPSLTGLEDAQAEGEIGWVVDLVSEVRSLRAEMALAGETELLLIGADAGLRSRVQQWDETLRKLARLSQIGFADVAPKSSAQLLVRGGVVAIPLEGVIDLDVEKTRLLREITKLNEDIKKLDAKLSNPGFLAKADADVVDEHKDRREEVSARIEKLTAALVRLG